MVDFVRAAANDPEVLAIKQTLYRVGSNSPIVETLSEARDEQTQVAVLVELKARFDEEPNITWASQLEARGVHVAYGIVGLKTHAKIALAVRREGAGLRRYVHLGTGNYNPSTARVYTDFSYFTDDPGFAEDGSDLFNRGLNSAARCSTGSPSLRCSCTTSGMSFSVTPRYQVPSG